jgi:hypothetical protein
MAAGRAAVTIGVDEQDEQPPLGSVAVLAGLDVLVAFPASSVLLLECAKHSHTRVSY